LPSTGLKFRQFEEFLPFKYLCLLSWRKHAKCGKITLSILQL
jgi:hypothetical protein